MADFALTGSPCHPFSRLRSNRSGTVEQHHEYETTMSSLLDWVETFEPKAWVMEQVQGFDMKYDKDASDTPMRRPGRLRCCSVVESKSKSKFRSGFRRI